MKKKKKAGKLRAWECSYAYDVSHYVDFHVMARSEEEADRNIAAQTQQRRAGNRPRAHGLLRSASG